MSFAHTLLDWFATHGRDLPWRGIDDPYRIWLSEIILQQTRIEQGRDYYHRFLAAFPTVDRLASATEEEVLRQWQGLGYYSRARHLHRAAQQVMEQWGGCFPTTSADLLTLSGVGRYTAAAVASFAFREPTPVIDGNVYRFISRLRGIATPIATDAAYRQFERLLQPLMDRERPDLFNAAMMDFGSLQCTPRPDCSCCPFASCCDALATGRVALLPVRPTKRPPTERWFHYFDLRWTADGHQFTLLHQREEGDIWQGLFEFPLYETAHPLDPTTAMATLHDFAQRTFGLECPTLRLGDDMRHQLTHRTLHARFIQAELPSPPPKIPANTLVVDRDELQNKPLPRLIDKYLHLL